MPQSPILKAIIAFVVSLAGLVTEGVIQGKPAAVIMAIFGILITLGVYVAPNKPPIAPNKPPAP